MSVPEVAWLARPDGVAHQPHEWRRDVTGCGKFWMGEPKLVSVLACQVHGVPVCPGCMPEVRPLKARAAG